ncbi:kinase-like domain-containing protein [Sporodiniella umbellata]|nr:kinase-like domain-containing protein [Sporodiniella umbellata]
MGQGTFGQVVQCRELSTSRYVAIKVIKRHHAFTAQGEKEIRILKMARQTDRTDRYLRLCEHFVFRGHICMVFELFSVSLHKVLRQTPRLSMVDIQHISIRVLETLDWLKQLHIVHTDLKPDNILLKSAEDLHDVKLIDYGSAILENELPLNYHIQTAFYRSPEVILRLPYTCAIDMWSFGCFVAEMFLTKPLFPSGNETFLIHMMAATLKSLPPDTMLQQGGKAKQFFQLKGTQQTTLRDTITHDVASLEERIMGVESEDSEQDRLALLSFLKAILIYDPTQRSTPKQALNHPFLAGLNEAQTSISTLESHEIRTPLETVQKPLKSILKKKQEPPLENSLYPPRPGQLHPMRIHPHYYPPPHSHYYSHPN